MAGRHAGEPATFDATVSDYVTQRARDLIHQADTWLDGPPAPAAFDLHEWIGAAAEILRELTRDA